MARSVVVEGRAPPEAGGAVRVTIDGREIAVFNLGGSLYAIDAACTHAGGPLDEGTVGAGRSVVCPWHGSAFDLTTGAVVEGPAQRPVRPYPVRTEHGRLVIEFP
jgi:nitrite reductase/ring-hydroxylating ferredoxin subunit